MGNPNNKSVDDKGEADLGISRYLEQTIRSQRNSLSIRQNALEWLELKSEMATVEDRKLIVFLAGCL